jgi:choline dehydrogenase-like flavoprotein
VYWPVVFCLSVGTCRVASDSTAVDAPPARVCGVEGSRVVDASIMPGLVSGNTDAPTLMIAEWVAASIRSTAAG